MHRETSLATDTRILILQASFGNSLLCSDLEQPGKGRCTHCCTRVEFEPSTRASNRRVAVAQRARAAAPAILLIGGDQRGQDRFYKETLQKADKLYDEHLEELKKEGLI